MQEKPVRELRNHVKLTLKRLEISFSDGESDLPAHAAFFDGSKVATKRRSVASYGRGIWERIRSALAASGHPEGAPDQRIIELFRVMEPSRNPGDQH
jgi:hypothetical protein